MPGSLKAVLLRMGKLCQKTQSLCKQGEGMTSTPTATPFQNEHDLGHGSKLLNSECIEMRLAASLPGAQFIKIRAGIEQYVRPFRPRIHGRGLGNESPASLLDKVSSPYK